MLNNVSVLSPRAYNSFVERFLEKASPVAPRGENTFEMINSTVVVANPIDRIITDTGRKMNIAFAVAEWYSIMFGIDDINFFTEFIKSYDKFSSDGLTLDGAYGTRINYETISKGETVNRSQIQQVIRFLKDDPSTRRAVISIYEAEDLFGKGGTNTPCTLSLQFLIRDDELNLIVNMRSSDIWLGLTYDLFVFTLIQEFVARRVGVKLGKYIHNAGSLHAYEKDLPNFKKLNGIRWPFLMGEMPVITDKDMRDFNKLMNEHFQRESFFTKANVMDCTPGMEYLLDLAMVMKCFIERSRSRLFMRTAYNSINDSMLRHMIRPWM